MVSYHILLKIKVSIKISSFPGFSNTVDYLIWFPSFISRDMLFPSMIASLNSYNFPRMELIVITPFDCLTMFFFFSWGFDYLSGLRPFFCYYSYWSYSLLLKKDSAWNSITPIYLFWNFMIVVNGSFLVTLTSRLKFRSNVVDIFSFPSSKSTLSFLPTLDLNVFFSEENIDSVNELSVW